MVQARNGFYWASGFVVLAVSALLAALPEAVASTPSLYVPALAAFNLQITTFFFVAGLVLLEREEGTLTALGASPASPRIYMTARTMTLGGSCRCRNARHHLDWLWTAGVMVASGRNRGDGRDLYRLWSRTRDAICIRERTPAACVCDRDPAPAAAARPLWSDVASRLGVASDGARHRIDSRCLRSDRIACSRSLASAARSLGQQEHSDSRLLVRSG